MELIFATNNKHKISEVQEIIGSRIQLYDLSKTGIVEELPENQKTLEGNALEKARFVYVKTGQNCFADDTGLEVETLNGEPGVYSARYAGPENNSEANLQKLLSKLSDKNNRNAQFRCVIALIINGKELFFEGVVKGKIITEKRGGDGFGYDPIFIPDGFENTFAEMTSSQKNKISHRAIAVNKLADFLRNY